MKRSYLFILIGLILIFIYFGIGIIDLGTHVIGYGLIYLGTYQLNESRHHDNLMLAQSLTLGLLLFEVLQGEILRVMAQQAIIAFLIVLLILAAKSLVFFLLIKSERDATESLTIQTYQQTDLWMSIGLIFLYIISCFIPSASPLFGLMEVSLFSFLVYAFYHIQTMYQS